MRDLFPAIQSQRADLAVIGNGDPAQAAAFSAERGLPFPVFTDPDRRAFAAAGLRASLLASLSPALVMNGIRAMRAGFRQGRIQGSALQQGGVVIVTPDGRVAARYVSKTGGDHPKDAWILEALGKLA